jgi:hypothetical protein
MWGIFFEDINFSAAPTDATNRLGAGFVRYLKSNLGRTYYDATAAGRGTQLPTLASVMTNAFGLLGAQPMLLARNAPATGGLSGFIARIEETFGFAPVCCVEAFLFSSLDVLQVKDARPFEQPKSLFHCRL